MIEDFDLKSLQKLVISTDSVEDAEKTERKLASIKRRAKQEGLPASFEISRENTIVIISESGGLFGASITLFHYKALSEESFKTLSKQIDDLEKIEKANKAAEKVVGKKNMYTPAKRQLGGYPRIQFNLSEKQPPAKLSPELEALLAEQKKMQEKSLFIKK